MTYIGFSTPRRFNPVSWLVRKFTGSRCSHTWFLYHDKDWGFDVVLEAHELGFRVIPFKRFKRANVIISIFTPVAESLDPGVSLVARRFLGTAYDFGGLVGMAVVLLGQWLKFKWRNPFNSRGVFCSEAAVIALQHAGFPNARTLVASRTSPDHLERFLKEALANGSARLASEENLLC